MGAVRGLIPASNSVVACIDVHPLCIQNVVVFFLTTFAGRSFLNERQRTSLHGGTSVILLLQKIRQRCRALVAASG